jgi:protease YdgD
MGRLAAVLLSILFAGAAVAQTPVDKLRSKGISRFDDRVPVDTTKMPWRAIGKLQTNIGTSCTGTLIAPRLVLTAGHCLFHPRSQNLLPLSSLHFLLGYDRANFVANANVIRAEHIPNLAEYTRQKSRDIENDWLILEIDQPLGTKYGMLKLADKQLRPGTKAQSAGYGQDKSQIMTGDLDCDIVTAPAPGDRPSIAHNCETTFGNSGGPLLVQQDGEWRVAGVMVRIVQLPDGQWLGYAFDVSVVRDRIAKLK